MKITKIDCVIPKQENWWGEQKADVRGFVQLSEVEISEHKFWFGVAQLNINIPQDRPAMFPNSTGFQIKFSDGRRGYAHAKGLKVAGEYVEMEFVGLSGLVESGEVW